jgi:hypothetical protein
MNEMNRRILLAAVIVAAICGSMRMIRKGAWTQNPEPCEKLRTLPAQLGPWTLDEKGGKHSFLDPPTDAAAASNGVYHNAAGVEIFVELDQFTMLDVSLPHPPEQCYNLSGCYVRAQNNFALPRGSQDPLNVRLMAVDHNGQRMSVLYWYNLDDEVAVDRADLAKVRWKLRDQKRRPLVVKVMMQTLAVNAADAENSLRSLAGPLMSWIHQMRRS